MNKRINVFSPLVSEARLNLAGSVLVLWFLVLCLLSLLESRAAADDPRWDASSLIQRAARARQYWTRDEMFTPFSLPPANHLIHAKQ